MKNRMDKGNHNVMIAIKKELSHEINMRLVGYKEFYSSMNTRGRVYYSFENIDWDAFYYEPVSYILDYLSSLYEENYAMVVVDEENNKIEEFGYPEEFDIKTNITINLEFRI